MKMFTMPQFCFFSCKTQTASRTNSPPHQSLLAAGFWLWELASFLD
jgi:hypothetical protein